MLTSSRKRWCIPNGCFSHRVCANGITCLSQAYVQSITNRSHLGVVTSHSAHDKVSCAFIIGKVNREGLCVADIMSSEIIVVDEETQVGETAHSAINFVISEPAWFYIIYPFQEYLKLMHASMSGSIQVTLPYLALGSRTICSLTSL